MAHRSGSLPAILAGALLALCACKETRPPPTPRPAEPPPVAKPAPKTAPAPDAGSAVAEPATTVVKVWFLDQQRMATGEQPLFVPVERRVAKADPVRGALEALFAGPDADERARGLKLVSSGASGFSELRVEEGVAHVRLAGGCNSGGSTATVAQAIGPTLKQFEQVQFVKIYDPQGKTEQPEGRTDSIPFCLEP